MTGRTERPRSETALGARRAAPAAIMALGAIVLVVGFGATGARERSVVSDASAWRGLVGGAHGASVTVGQRVLVVLKAPSLAQRVAANGGLATERQEHY